MVVNKKNAVPLERTMSIYTRLEAALERDSRLRVGQLLSTSVELVIGDEVPISSAMTVQMLVRRSEFNQKPATWKQVCKVENPRIRIPLSVAGAVYTFRLYDEDYLREFSDEVSVLTPPPPPTVCGLGRNACVAWPNSQGALEPDFDDIRYIVEWRRVEEQTDPTAPPEEGTMRLVRRKIEAEGRPESVMVAAFPVLKPNSTYEFRVVAWRKDEIAAPTTTSPPPPVNSPDFKSPVRRASSIKVNRQKKATRFSHKEGKEECVPDQPSQKSAPSERVTWQTGLKAPVPTASWAPKFQLKLPSIVDELGLLEQEQFGLTYALEGSGDDDDADPAAADLRASTKPAPQCWGRRWSRLLSSEGQGSLLRDSTVTVQGLPADASCKIRARCRLDLRSLGAQSTYSDETAELDLETPPLPPTFNGRSEEQDSCTLSWPTRTVHLAVQTDIDDDIDGLLMDAPLALLPELEPVLYKVELWDSEVEKFGTTPIYVGTAGSVELGTLGGIPLRAGECRLVRLLRLECSSGTVAMPPRFASAVVCCGPLPPRVEKLKSVHLSNEEEERAEVRWDAALDVSHLPDEVCVGLPLQWSLEAASGPACERSMMMKKQQQQQQQRGSRLPESAFRVVGRSSGAGSLVSEPLKPGMCYLFRTRLTTRFGTCVSATVELRTRARPPARPHPPRAEKAFFVSVSGRRAAYLKLSWETPPHNGMPVDRHQLQVKRRVSSTWKTLYLGPQSKCADDATLDNDATNIKDALIQYRVKSGSCLGWSDYSEVTTIADWKDEEHDRPVEEAPAPTAAILEDEHVHEEEAPRLKEVKPKAPPCSSTVLWPEARAHEALPYAARVLQAELISRVSADFLSYPVASDVFARAYRDLMAIHSTTDTTKQPQAVATQNKKNSVIMKTSMIMKRKKSSSKKKKKKKKISINESSISSLGPASSYNNSQFSQSASSASSSLLMDPAASPYYYVEEEAATPPPRRSSSRDNLASSGTG